MDNRYYRKNAQLRYQLSKELDIYKQKKEKAEKSKIDPFFIPLLSSAIAIATAIASFMAVDSDYNLGIRAYWLLLIVAGVFIVAYILMRYALCPICIFIKNEFRHFRPINKRFYKKLSYERKLNLLAKFDYDITGLIHLSYVIATDINEKDPVLNEYNRGEALFYIDRSLKKIQNVFTDYPEYTPNIYEYRIKNNMDLLAAAIVTLSQSTAIGDSIKTHIDKAVDIYNIVGKSINDKYSKQIVSLIEET